MEQVERFLHETVMDDIQLLLVVYGLNVLFDIEALQRMLEEEYKYRAPICLLEKLIG